MSHLHLDLGFIKVVGKGSKERIVPLGDVALDALMIIFKTEDPISIKSVMITCF
jgi:integrase/recombinase XerD